MMRTASFSHHSNVGAVREPPLRCAIIFAIGLVAFLSFVSIESLHAAETDFAKVLAAAKQEGKVVVAIPPSADLRKQTEAAFKGKFGVDVELVAAPGPQNASRIAAEQKAGVQYFDALIVGPGTALSLAHGGLFEPIERNMILAEVKDPKNWWGGHIWEDNVKTRSEERRVGKECRS